MKQINRRNFLRKSLVAGAATGLWPLLGRGQNAPASTTSAISNQQVRGANEDLRAAVIGLNGRGRDHVKQLSALKGVRVAALCDVDTDVLDRETKSIRDSGGVVETFTDIRRLLESKEIDVVTIATPHQWHALASIWSVQAGKDVYVEKPVSYSVWEGRKIVEAARKHGRIVQSGTQIRSNPGVVEAIAWVRAGNLGKIKLARGLCYKRRDSIGKTSGPQPVPATVNYDLWTGPASLVPLRRKRLHYDWHWIWDTGNGDLGNQGIHQMDIARWALGEAQVSPGVISIGGRLGYDDDGQTPNTQIVFHDYPTAPLIFEVRGLPSGAGSAKMDGYHDASIGVVVHCEHGELVIPSYTTAIARDNDGKEIRRFEGAASHFQNFLDAVRSRKFSELHADILEGHISSALCHTANISNRLGAPHSPDEIRDALKSYTSMAETFARMQEHLGANGVELVKTPLLLGAHLEMNPTTERFSENSRANDLLTREFRKPFVVPDKV
jgi:predicted dehydrogenase